jgi:cobalt/nickel transport system ATP-binding protein
VADPVIEVRALTFAYPAGPTALEAVSLHISPGESVGLIGPNGAGKTTLFLCLAGVLPIAQGTIRVAGLDPGILAERRCLPAKVGIIFQNSEDQLFCTTVLDDVAFGPLNLGLSADEVRQRVKESLQRMGAEDLEQRSPQLLSGGEKRRVALAGVLAMRPDIFLLDEPSMYLDPRGRRDLLGLVSSLPGTRILASHDLEMILQTCERTLLLDQGRLIADGRTRELLANAALMEAHGLEVPYSLRSR